MYINWLITLEITLNLKEFLKLHVSRSVVLTYF